MKRIIIWSSAIALIGLFIGQTTFAADAKETGSAGKSPGASNEAGSEKPKLSQAELEANFKTTLTKATLTGRWCSINASPEGRLKMGPEKDEKYTIVGVSKGEGDSWLIRARIQYGKVDLVAPIPVQVKWAGDTPVIIVDNIAIPGGGNYSARLLIYERTYAGTWSGGDHRGLLNGVITNGKADPE